MKQYNLDFLAIVNQENTLKGVFERQSYLEHAYRTEHPKSHRTRNGG